MARFSASLALLMVAAFATVHADDATPVPLPANASDPPAAAAHTPALRGENPSGVSVTNVDPWGLMNVDPWGLLSTIANAITNAPTSEVPKVPTGNTDVVAGGV